MEPDQAGPGMVGGYSLIDHCHEQQADFSEAFGRITLNLGIFGQAFGE